MHRYLLFVLLNLFTINLFGQNNSIPQIIRAQTTLNELSTVGVSPNNISYGIPVPSGEVIGDFYLDKKWNKTSILMYENDQLLEGYLTRFNIEDSRLEIRLNTGIRFIDISQFKSLVWIDSLLNRPRFFLNAADYSLEGIKLIGLLEVLVDGNYPLFKRVTVQVKPPNYNVALDVGSRDTKILKNESYYFANENKLVEIKRKKDIIEFFEDKDDELESFISKHKLLVSKEKDLATIFRQINK